MVVDNRNLKNQSVKFDSKSSRENFVKYKKRFILVRKIFLPLVESFILIYDTNIWFRMWYPGQLCETIPYKIDFIKNIFYTNRFFKKSNKIHLIIHNMLQMSL